MKKLLVTGSSGFLGEYVMKEAQSRGYNVLGFDIIEPKNVDYDYIVGDITNETDVRKAYEQKPDYVIHLAANSRATDMDYKNNVSGFINMIDTAVKYRWHRCEKFVYASTSAIYVDSF